MAVDWTGRLATFVTGTFITKSCFGTCGAPPIERLPPAVMSSAVPQTIASQRYVDAHCQTFTCTLWAFIEEP